MKKDNLKEGEDIVHQEKPMAQHTGELIMKKQGRVTPKPNLIHRLLYDFGKLHFSLIDPDKQTPKQAGKIAQKCEEAGTHAILVGGTTVPSQEMMYNTIKEIKNATNCPVILFPNCAETVPENLNYILFMMLVNAADEAFFRGEQVKGAPLIKAWNIQPISTGYIIISTSEQPTAVERHVPLDKIRYSDVDKAVNYALYAEMSGMSCLYFEAGSGAERPVSNEMIQAVRTAVDIPIIVGGGIRDGDTAGEKIEAGADVIVTGTVIEENKQRLQEIIQAITSFK